MQHDMVNYIATPLLPEYLADFRRLETMNNGFLKRFFDLMIAVPSVIVLSPLLGLIGFMVRMRIGSPVLFCQERPGLYGKPFIIYKFRTIMDVWDEKGKLLPDGERLTRLGRSLRKTSMARGKQAGHR